MFVYDLFDAKLGLVILAECAHFERRINRRKLYGGHRIHFC